MTSSSDSRKLESLPLENWESSLSFLPAREILLASHELSKSFGVEKNGSDDADEAAADAVVEESDAVNVEETDQNDEKEESPDTNEDTTNATGNTNTCYDDRHESAERAAKLALQNMLTRAWKYFDAYKEEHPDMIPYDDIHANLSYSPDMIEKHFTNVPRLEGESYMRTYHLSLSMVKFGKIGVEKYTDIGNRNSYIESFPLIFTMWLIYGKPYLPPIDDDHFKIAEIVSKEFVFVIDNDKTPPPTPDDDGYEMTKRHYRQISAQQYCFWRILRISDRFRQIGIYDIAGATTDAILYKCLPGQIECCYDAEFFIETKVILQGLSRTELNGKVGIVKSNFNPSNGRIGILLEGRDKLVGIKPINLATQEVDSTLIIDCKILSAQIAHDSMECDLGDFHPGISKEIHILRKVISALEAKIKNDEGEDDRALDDEIRSGLFPTDLVRLIKAKFTLIYCLVARAKVVFAHNLHPLHGNLRPDHEDWEEFENQPDMNNPSVKALFVTNLMLEEAMDQISEISNRYVGMCEAQFQPSEIKREICPEGQRPMPHKGTSSPYAHTLACLDFAKHLVLSTAGVLGHTRGVSFLSIESEMSSELMTANAIKFARKLLEGTMYLFFGLKGGALTIDTGKFFGKSRRFRQQGCATLIYFARYLGCVYRQASFRNMSAVAAALNAQNEWDDGIHFLRLSLFLAMKSFGTGHPYTKVTARLVKMKVGSIDTYDGLAEENRLKEDLNAWFSGSYRCLYFKSPQPNSDESA